MDNNKKIYLAVTAVIVLLALFGTIKAFSTPDRITQEKTAALLSYEHSGTFDYRAAVKPASFYDTYQETAAATQIPLHYIESISMSYIYTSPETGTEETEINAVLENPNNWQKTVALVPRQAAAGSFVVNFTVDFTSLQELADIIEKEWGAGYSSHNLNIVANVYAGGTMVHSQSLALKLSKSLLVIDNNLVETPGQAVGSFKYDINLLDNTLYGAVTISSPQISTNTTVLGPQDTVFTKLLDSLNFTYTYDVTSEQNLGETAAEVTIKTVLGDAEKWTKTYVLVPATRQTGDFTVDFPLDIAQYAAILTTIQQETGVLSAANTLALQADVHLTAKTSAGTIDKVFSHRIETDLKSGVLTWTGELQKTEAGSIETTVKETTPEKLWGMPVIPVRVMSVIVLCIGVCLATILFLSITDRRTDRNTLLRQNTRQTEQKYQNMIIRVNEMPDTGSSETTLTVSSLAELIKVAQSLLKPVNHLTNDSEEVYWLSDGAMRYVYRIEAVAEQKPASIPEPGGESPPTP